MPLRIEPAADHPDLIPRLGRWHWQEWGHHDPGGSLESWTEALRARTCRDRVPATFIAFEDTRPVGSAALVEHDMDTRRDLGPWLAGVFVLPDCRGRGIASALCCHAAEAARGFGVTRLYLYTNGAERLYESLGWHPFGREPYEGRTVTLMHLDLSLATASRRAGTEGSSGRKGTAGSQSDPAAPPRGR